MSALHIHLVTVHFPIIGFIFVLITLFAAQFSRQEILFKLGYTFILLCVVSGIIAYVSGPLAYEQLEGKLDQTFVENHAIVGKAAFVIMILVGVIALTAFLQYWQEEKPSLLHQWAILLGVIVVCCLFAWTAHLGGQIRHLEIRW